MSGQCEIFGIMIKVIRVIMSSRCFIFRDFIPGDAERRIILMMS